jgi:GMP synthase-like glutamine amidotransferase
VLGGAQAAYDPVEVFPWVSATLALLREAVATGVPTLGLCLGGQLLALAVGGSVIPGREGPEIGPMLVGRRDVSYQDPLFAALPMAPDVIGWHVDEIATLPPGAVVLANSPVYANQAFRIGDCAWGTQFHIETTPDMLRQWAASGRRQLDEVGVDAETLLTKAIAALDDIAQAWRPFAFRFADFVRGRYTAA